MLGRWLRGLRPPPEIPEADWRRVLDALPFLAARRMDERERLRELSARFLQQKEFHGALGFTITDEVALLIAAQAVLPLLHLPGDLGWYDDFVGIVVVPSEVSTRRTLVDEAGVVHEYDEAIIGEAREHGPVMLSWPHVAEGAAGTQAGPILNVVIHEFAHKIDMRDGQVDGCPPLPIGFMGSTTALQARERWLAALQPAYDRFREQAIVAERFGGEPPWLDDYAASSLAEFFAVACEAYFVDRARFIQELSGLASAFDAFFLANDRQR
ncbi:MAG: zinc-dependent peptidase [Pseudacidovorax sp.]|nr:zinc-dependent peptidase [Pseudacidovorax sp.]